jgi:N-acyl-L-homoserine lactone synthetase
LRLLPTTGPTVLADFFSDTLPDAVHLSAPSIWECTRFCLDDRILSRGNQEELYFACAVLIAALGDVAIKPALNRSSVISILQCCGSIDALGARLTFSVPHSAMGSRFT